MSPTAGRHAPAGAVRGGTRVPRPVRPFIPLLSSVTVLGAWALVAHNGGAGWVQAVGDIVAGTLLVGLVGPAAVVWRARLRVVDSPTDATAGMPVELLCAATTRVGVRPLEPSGPEAFVGPGRHTAADARATVTLLPGGRGVHHEVVAAVSSAAPFGLLWWTRRIVVRLPVALHVGPRLGAPLSLPPRPDDVGGSSTRRATTDVGEPRGVRPYHPGDNRRRVHWPATAHAAELMVREMEGPTAEPVTVTVRLPGDPAAAERLAERALGTVVALTDAGTPVVLDTVEAGGVRVAQVAGRRAAGRRLARTVDGHTRSEGVTVTPSPRARTAGRVEGATR